MLNPSDRRPLRRGDVVRYSSSAYCPACGRRSGCDCTDCHTCGDVYSRDPDRDHECEDCYEARVELDEEVAS